MKKLFLFNLLMTFCCICTFAAKPKPVQKPVVKPGIEVLVQEDFAPLKGRRVGLVTNPSGVDSNLRSTVDILYNAPQVQLVALFGPEHGVRGDVYAGGKVKDSIDSVTGLPVYSLYGSTRKPTPEMLDGIDVMVYDIQDVGVRSYTAYRNPILFVEHLYFLLDRIEVGVSSCVSDRTRLKCGGDRPAVASVIALRSFG